MREGEARSPPHTLYPWSCTQASLGGTQDTRLWRVTPWVWSAWQSLSSVENGKCSYLPASSPPLSVDLLPATLPQGLEGLNTAPGPLHSPRSVVLVVRSR